MQSNLLAQVSLKIKNKKLVYAGRGYQPTADFNKGDIIASEADVVECDWDNMCHVKLPNGQTVGVSHADYVLSAL